MRGRGAGDDAAAGALSAAERAGGILLVGGQSRRMGRPKAWLSLHGRPMAAVVLEAMRSALGGTAPIVVVAAPGQEIPPLGDVAVVHDATPDQGPLEGMAAGLEALQGRAGAAFVSSCDVPLLRAAFIGRMLALLGRHDIAVPRVDGRYHPLAAAYRVALLPRVRQLLASGLRRPFFLFDAVDTLVVEAAALGDVDPSLESLQNVNTPEDYQRLRQAAGDVTGLGTAAGQAGPGIVFELFGLARLRAGRGEVAVAASSLGQALSQLALACPELRGEVISGDDGPAVLTRHYKVSRNGRRFVSDPDLALADGDRLLLLSAEAGG